MLGTSASLSQCHNLSKKVVVRNTQLWRVCLWSLQPSVQHQMLRWRFVCTQDITWYSSRKAIVTFALWSFDRPTTQLRSLLWAFWLVILYDFLMSCLRWENPWRKISIVWCANAILCVAREDVPPHSRSNPQDRFVRSGWCCGRTLAHFRKLGNVSSTVVGAGSCVEVGSACGCARRDRIYHHRGEDTWPLHPLLDDISCQNLHK